MSNVTTRRFVVLSQSVNTSDDVFNALIEVKDKESGEVGTLLCSHMCAFPQELISQATWLEGCKTPEQFKDEPRLALGYHPEQYTQWKVFKETNEIEIYLTGSWNQDADADGDGYQDGDSDGNGDQWYIFNFPYHNTFFNMPRGRGTRGVVNRYQQCLSRFRASLVRLCRRVLTENITQQSLNDFESLIHRLFNSGRITGWEALVLPNLLLSNEPIHWQGPDDLFMPGLSPYLDGGVFSEDHWVIPYTRSEEGLVVTASIPEAGFQKAIDFDLVYENGAYESPTVLYCNPDEIVSEEYIVEE